MPKTELSDEQKQVKRILSRCKRAAWIFLFLMFLPLVLGLPIAPLIPKTREWEIGFLLFLAVSMIAFPYAYSKFAWRWVRKLTSNEVKSLKAVAASDDVHLLRMQKEVGRFLDLRQTMMPPEEELLRAAMPSDSETLLRPLLANPEMPKEELLRAAHGKNE